MNTYILKLLKWAVFVLNSLPPQHSEFLYFLSINQSMLYLFTFSSFMESRMDFVTWSFQHQALFREWNQHHISLQINMPRLITVRDYWFIARNNPTLALLQNITLFDFVSVLFYYLRVINVRLHITYNVLQCCAAQGHGVKSILTQYTTSDI